MKHSSSLQFFIRSQFDRTFVVSPFAVWLKSHRVNSRRDTLRQWPDRKVLANEEHFNTIDWMNQNAHTNVHYQWPLVSDRCYHEWRIHWTTGCSHKLVHSLGCTETLSQHPAVPLMLKETQTKLTLKGGKNLATCGLIKIGKLPETPIASTKSMNFIFTVQWKWSALHEKHSCGFINTINVNYFVETLLETLAVEVIKKKLRLSHEVVIKYCMNAGGEKLSLYLILSLATVEGNGRM